MDLEYLKSKRASLEDRVRLMNPKQIMTELGVYDKILDAKEIRGAKIKNDAEKARPEYHLILDEYDDEVLAAALSKEHLETLLQNYSEENVRAVLKTAREKLVSSGGEDRYAHRRESNIHRHADAFGHKPAYIVVLNYTDAHKEYITKGTGCWANGIVIQNGKEKNRHVIGENFFSKKPEVEKEIYSISHEDSAILLDCKGIIIATNAELEDQQEELGLNDETLNQKLGIIAGGNRRQHAAAFASKKMAGTVIYTLGEETPHIRRFYDGSVTFSTHPEEDELARDRLTAAGYDFHNTFK